MVFVMEGLRRLAFRYAQIFHLIVTRINRSCFFFLWPLRASVVFFLHLLDWSVSPLLVGFWRLLLCVSRCILKHWRHMSFWGIPLLEDTYRSHRAASSSVIGFFLHKVIMPFPSATMIRSGLDLVKCLEPQGLLSSNSMSCLWVDTSVLSLGPIWDLLDGRFF